MSETEGNKQNSNNEENERGRDASQSTPPRTTPGAPMLGASRTVYEAGPSQSVYGGESSQLMHEAGPATPHSSPVNEPSQAPIQERTPSQEQLFARQVINRLRVVEAYQNNLNTGRSIQSGSQNNQNNQTSKPSRGGKQM